MTHATHTPGYRYRGKAHRASELATRLVDVGVQVLSDEGIDADQARAMMRATIGQVFSEWGADTMYVPKELAFDGLTDRDRAIWAAWQGNNRHELCQQFNLSPRMLAYVLEHCRRWQRERNEPQLPFDLPANPQEA